MSSLVSGASLAKQLFEQVGAEATSLARLLMATVLMILFWRPWNQKPNFSELKIIFFYGSVLGLMNLSFYKAISYMPIGLAVALEFLGPLTVAILNSRKKLDFLWVLLAFLGVVLIIPLTDYQQPLQPKGVFFALLAAFFWALYIVLGQNVAQNVKPTLAAPYGMLFGSLVVFPWGANELSKLFVNSHFVLLAVIVGLLSSAIPYSLEMVALKKIKPKEFSLFLSLEPALAAVAGFFFLSEKLNIVQILAIFFVIAASAGSAYFSNSKKQTVADL